MHALPRQAVWACGPYFPVWDGLDGLEDLEEDGGSTRTDPGF